jgi:hypothetical protein
MEKILIDSTLMGFITNTKNPYITGRSVHNTKKNNFKTNIGGNVSFFLANEGEALTYW